MSMASDTNRSNFFKKQWTQTHPQYLSELSRALYLTTFLEIAVWVTCFCYREAASMLDIEDTKKICKLFELL